MNDLSQSYPYRIGRRLGTNLENAVRFIRFLLSRKPAATEPCAMAVYLDIPEPKLERYFYLLAKFFQLAGWQVNVRLSPNLLLNLRNYSYLIYDIPALRVVRKRPEKVDLYIGMVAAAGQETSFRLDPNYFSKEKESDSHVLPYQMHPDVYHFGISEAVHAMRAETRTFCVLFAGNCIDNHDNPDIRKLFQKINRRRLSDIVDGLIDGGTFKKIGSRSQFLEIARSEGAELLLLQKNVKLDINEWMRALASVDFYIAAPGVSMPFAHNAVEAMAVGAIPIIEYGDLFTPALEAGVNCVAFSGEDDFVEKIAYCLAMPDEEIARLRAGVINYYETYLEPKAVIDRLWRKSSSISKLYVNCEHISVAELKREIG